MREKQNKMGGKTKKKENKQKKERQNKKTKINEKTAKKKKQNRKNKYTLGSYSTFPTRFRASVN
jgi:hypothetical protein